MAQTEGSLGFLLELAFANELPGAGFRKDVATFVTQVEVDAADPAFLNPSKPIGPFFSRERAAALEESAGWIMVEDAGRGWRKVVASPKPRSDSRRRSRRGSDQPRATSSSRRAAAGIPVVVSVDGQVRGVEAVIDKDYSASMLAATLSADLFIILTGVDRVARDFGKPTQEEIPQMDVVLARRLLAEGQFPPGSMGPKIDAAIRYIEAGGRQVLIARAETLADALEGRTGTIIREEERKR